MLATLEPSDRERGIVRVSGAGSREPGEDPGVPGLVVAAEQYNRLARLVAEGGDVQVEVDVRARFHDDDVMAHNTVAEIPGTDRRGEVVMIGAHLDSWHGGTGATDNAAGSAVAMEAMRILQALGVKPKRTIRIGALDRRGAGPARRARLREPALRLASRAVARGARAALVPAPPPAARSRSSRSTR